MYLGVDDFPHEFLIENGLISVDFLENKTGEITVGVYFVSITEIISSCQQVGSGGLLIVNRYILGFLRGNQCV